MKPISQFEPSKPVSRTMTQLTALVADLRKEVCNLETSIEDEEDRAPSLRARIFHAPPSPIVAHPRDRRDNLLLTISTLENQLNDPISLQGAVTVSATLRRSRAPRRRRRPLANVEWLRSTEACCP
jgi:hypothetical protein